MHLLLSEDLFNEMEEVAAGERSLMISVWLMIYNSIYCEGLHGEMHVGDGRGMLPGTRLPVEASVIWRNSLIRRLGGRLLSTRSECVRRHVQGRWRRGPGLSFSCPQRFRRLFRSSRKAESVDPS